MKKVETTVIKYVAFDGTEFNNKQTCHDYETNLYDNLIKDTFDRCTIKTLHSYDFLYCDENVDIFIVECTTNTYIQYINWYIEYWIDYYSLGIKGYPKVKEGQYVIIQDDDGYIYKVLPYDEYVKELKSKLL